MARLASRLAAAAVPARASCRHSSAKRALDFVERLQSLSDYDAICRLIVQELEWFGLTCVTSWAVPGPGCELKDGIQFNNRPQEYIDRYVEKNYVAYEPVITELEQTVFSSNSNGSG